MSFWGKLFGSDKAIEGVVDGVSSGLDKLWYTDEEKNDDKKASLTEARTMIIQWLKNTQGQNLSRRLIALSIMFTWLFMHLVSTALAVVAVWSEKITEAKLIASAELISNSAGDMVSAVMLILGFYFAAPYMGSIAEASLKKFGKDNAGERVG